jgi:hypothetical protein
VVAYGVMLTQRPARWLLTAIGLLAVGSFGLTSFGGALLVDGVAWPARADGASYARGGAGHVVGNLLAGPLLGRCPARRLVVAISKAMAQLIGLCAGAHLGQVATIAVQPLAGVLGAINWIGLTASLTRETPVGGAAAGGTLLAFGGFAALGWGRSGFLVLAAILTVNARLSSP